MQIKNISQKSFLKDLGRFAEKSGSFCRVVGGPVRDAILNRRTEDIDVISENDCLPLAKYCAKKYKGTLLRFDSFGTIRVTFPKERKIDFARTRCEIYKKPAVLPKVFPAALEKDLFRRDFTVNAMAMSINPENFGELNDPFNGLKDIKNKTLKILHDKSFQDDPTRLYRVCRFAGRFGWKLDKKTEKLFKEAVRKKYPNLLSCERVRNELLAILKEKNPKRIFNVMREYDLLRFIFPNLKWSQSISKSEDVFIRLGILACKTKNGLEFLKSLNLERKVFLELKTAVEINKQKQSPINKISKDVKKIIFCCNPGLPKIALEPLRMTGNDLKKMGLKPGPKFSKILQKSAKLQWRGIRHLSPPLTRL
jgi:tRNA nucleotidyltransferase/poly(A) polymerase